MFYSRELLARKASLGQIWLLGTMQSKLDRRKANKLDVASLCEEILNPPVPMALRLSSILMGGLVILYERKVMILHDDANRLLVELRNAWKIMEEPTLLPKRKARAGRKTITLPENEETEVEDSEDEEEHLMGFNQNRVNLQLDQIDEYYIANDPMEDNLTHDNHQADYNDITLLDSFQPDTTTIHGQFERFEEGDDGTQQNFSLDGHIQISPTLVPSPPRQDGPPRAEEIPEQHQEHQCDQQFNTKEEAKDLQRPGAVKRRARKAKGIIMDMEQICIPNHVYQSWLHDNSDIVSRRAKRRKRPTNVLSALKLDKLMELPSIVLMHDMVVKENQEIPYPAPVLELWKINTQPDHDSPSERTSQPQPPEPSFPDFPFEDLHSGVGSPSHAVNIEVQRTNVLNNVSTPAEQTRVIMSNTSSGRTNQHFSHGNSGDGAGNTGSSVSGDGVPPNNLNVNLRRVGSKRNNVPSIPRSNGSLETVAEVFHEADANYRLSSPQQNNLTPDQDFWVETQPTFEAPASDPPDIITENIKNFLKTHFETPGAPKVESLNDLAAGLNKKGAAQLFYQTCVLASKGFLKVDQRVPFGDIFISKGAKM